MKPKVSFCSGHFLDDRRARLPDRSSPPYLHRPVLAVKPQWPIPLAADLPSVDNSFNGNPLRPYSILGNKSPDLDGSADKCRPVSHWNKVLIRSWLGGAGRVHIKRSMESEWGARKWEQQQQQQENTVSGASQALSPIDSVTMSLQTPAQPFYSFSSLATLSLRFPAVYLLYDVLSLACLG